MLSTVNVVVRKAPGLEPAVLGLRAAYSMLANGGFETRILYMGDGVFNLLSVPGYVGGLLERFRDEGGMVCALETSMEERGLSEDDVIKGVEIVDNEAAAEMIQEADATTTF
jgi:tRNA 2-thiouridine synthesizing protein C